MRQCGNTSRYARGCWIMSLFCQNCHPISLVNRKFEAVWENLSLRERLEPILDLCHYLCHTSYYFLHIIDKNQPKVSQAKQICFESGIMLCIFNIRTNIAPLPDCEGTLTGLIHELWALPVLNGFASSAFWVWSLVSQSYFHSFALTVIVCTPAELFQHLQSCICNPISNSASGHSHMDIQLSQTQWSSTMAPSVPWTLLKTLMAQKITLHVTFNLSPIVSFLTMSWLTIVPCLLLYLSHLPSNPYPFSACWLSISKILECF